VDDLSAPLGQDKAQPRKLTLPAAVPWAVAGLLSLSVLVFAGWAMLADDPLGGEPVAVARADLSAANADRKPVEAPPRTLAGQAANERPNRYDGPPADAAAGSRTVTIIDGTSGKRQEVVIPGPAAEAKPPATDTRPTENSRHGPIPAVAQDGARAAELYARAVKPIPGKPNAPRIAIVVGGLGVSATATSEALSKLPGAVTFAFTPYGNNVDQLATRARGDGHELLLLVPMEPFDYPDNDPGPQTLLTTLDSGQNIDRLQWSMSRFQGYVGVANYMGGRFTASEQALSPVLKEVGKRGLIYLDDGSSQRSIAPQIATTSNLPFAKADVVLDTVPTAVDIDRALGRLERIARERGSAVGAAGALPVSIERIAKWAKGAEGRGVLLVPISDVASKAKSS
jgi:polysaccharide deacetylase 2 family uncharacterized protein YibQ